VSQFDPEFLDFITDHMSDVFKASACGHYDALNYKDCANHLAVLASETGLLGSETPEGFLNADVIDTLYSMATAAFACLMWSYGETFDQMRARLSDRLLDTHHAAFHAADGWMGLDHYRGPSFQLLTEIFKLGGEVSAAAVEIADPVPPGNAACEKQLWEVLTAILAVTATVTFMHDEVLERAQAAQEAAKEYRKHGMGAMTLIVCAIADPDVFAFPLGEHNIMAQVERRLAGNMLIASVDLDEVTAYLSACEAKDNLPMAMMPVLGVCVPQPDGTIDTVTILETLREAAMREEGLNPDD
jgi:hypothetical protein